MIGNDIIDLSQSRIESNWRRIGFVDKLFTDSEQQLIKKHHNPEIMVWLLWSMKEAAYKIYNRQTKIREYIPKKLVCSVISLDEFQAQGFVICNENKYYSKSKITPENIHTVATTNCKDLDKIMEVDKKEIRKNENGIPYLVLPFQDYPKDVSISHHGRFERVVAIK